MIGLEDYDNKTKNDWRNWAWNRTVDHCLPPRPGKLAPWSKVDNREKRRLLADKVILYLCGPDDFDRSVALKHGFRNENLIAVDVNESNVIGSRRQGGLGVCCAIEELLPNWPQDFPVSGIVADLCCGLTIPPILLIDSLFMSKGIHSSPKVSLVVNMQRGRDAATNDLRDGLASICERYAEELDLLCCEGPEWRRRQFKWVQKSLPDSITEIGKNRAKHFVCLLALVQNQRLSLFNACCEPASVSMAYKLTISSFFSYRSKPAGRVIMDSAATVFFPRDEYRIDLDDELKRSMSYKSADGREAVLRRIAALRAVRTMKMRCADEHN